MWEMGAERAEGGAPEGEAEFVFLGTGVSTALPRLDCVVRGDCAVCRKGYEDELNPNRRCNVSGVVRTAGGQCVMVDCGKTMREAVLRWFKRNGIHGVHAVLLTHDHADATHGLDDLRELQFRDRLHRPVDLAVHADGQTLSSLRKGFAYLFPREQPMGDIVRRVAHLNWVQLPEAFQTFTPVEGLRVTPVPLLHGGDYICQGFVFGNAGGLVYLSDFHEVPEKTLEFLASLPPIRVLVLDALMRRPHPSHASLEYSVGLALRLRPAQAFFVGMSCVLGDHDACNKELAKKSDDDAAAHPDKPRVALALAHDGLKVHFPV